MYFIDLQQISYHENVIFEKFSQLFSKATATTFRIYYYHLENLLQMIKKIIEII